jgi:hypothetical protein
MFHFRIQILLLLLIYFINSSFSQEKRHVYYNDKYKEISKEDFTRQLKNLSFIDVYHHNETQVNCILIKRKNKGQLNDTLYAKLKLSLYPNKKMDNDLALIVFYPGLDDCNKNVSLSIFDNFDEKFLKKLNKIGASDHFFIYKYEELSKSLYSDFPKWQRDKNEVIENLFFKYHYPCASFVVIDKKGNYISFFGEYDNDAILDLFKELKSKN